MIYEKNLKINYVQSAVHSKKKSKLCLNLKPRMIPEGFHDEKRLW
jgi:hypothetical protein